MKVYIRISLVILALSAFINQNSFADSSVNITTQPKSIFTCEKSDATFYITVSGSIKTFQWKKNGVPILGANNIEYKIDSVTNENEGVYSVDVISTSNDTLKSNDATLTVSKHPLITSSSQNLSKYANEQAKFYVNAEGDELNYIWRKDGREINGANKSILLINQITPKDTGSYDCVVYNYCSSAITPPNRLTLASEYTEPYIVSPLEEIQFGQIWIGEQKDTIIKALYKNVGRGTWDSYHTVMDTVNFKLISPIGPITLFPQDTVTFHFKFRPLQSDYVYDYIGFSSNSENVPLIKLSGVGISVKYSLSKPEYSIKINSLSQNYYYDTITFTNTALASYRVKFKIESSNSFISLANPSDTIANLKVGDFVKIPIKCSSLAQNKDFGSLKIMFDRPKEPVYINIKVATTVGVENEEAQAFEIKPNPASEKIKINIDEKYINANYNIIDELGRNAGHGEISGKDEIIDISILKPGVYFMIIEKGDSRLTKKFIVE